MNTNLTYSLSSLTVDRYRKPSHLELTVRHSNNSFESHSQRQPQGSLMLTHNSMAVGFSLDPVTVQLDAVRCKSATSSGDDDTDKLRVTGTVVGAEKCAVQFSMWSGSHPPRANERKLNMLTDALVQATMHPEVILIRTAGLQDKSKAPLCRNDSKLKPVKSRG